MATYETAKNQFIKVGDLTFAYRRLGPSQGIPLVFIPGFRQTMDHWDPALVNPLAAKRPVLFIDNVGVGRSQGSVPDTLAGWASIYISVLQALGVTSVDVLGYSMGGSVAQLLALNAPDLVRRLVLCGTTPSSGEGVTASSSDEIFKRVKRATTEEEHRSAFMDGFFVKGSERSQEAGRKAWQRIANARSERSDYVVPGEAHKQAVAFAKFMTEKKIVQNTTYSRFDELRLPVLIASGCEDLLLPTENSILMWKKLRYADAHLHLYPDSGHGFLYQYADEFAKLINDFLGSSSAAGPGPSSRL